MYNSAIIIALSIVLILTLPLASILKLVLFLAFCKIISLNVLKFFTPLTKIGGGMLFFHYCFYLLFSFVI